MDGRCEPLFLVSSLPCGHFRTSARYFRRRFSGGRIHRFRVEAERRQILGTAFNRKLMIGRAVGVRRVGRLADKAGNEARDRSGAASLRSYGRACAWTIHAQAPDLALPKLLVSLHVGADERLHAALLVRLLLYPLVEVHVARVEPELEHLRLLAVVSRGRASAPRMRSSFPPYHAVYRRAYEPADCRRDHRRHRFNCSHVQPFHPW